SGSSYGICIKMAIHRVPLRSSLLCSLSVASDSCWIGSCMSFNAWSPLRRTLSKESVAMAYIELNNVCIGFGSGTNRTEVLSNIHLSIGKGEFVALLGFSGTGKTTLMNLIAGLIRPDSGEVLVDGKRVEGPDPKRGLVFQNYSLLPW